MTDRVPWDDVDAIVREVVADLPASFKASQVIARTTAERRRPEWEKYRSCPPRWVLGSLDRLERAGEVRRRTTRSGRPSKAREYVKRATS